MANKNNIGVDNLVENAFVHNEEKAVWQSEEICHAKVKDDRTLRQKNADQHKKMAEGLNKVMLLSASFRWKGSQEIFVLHLRNVGKDEKHAWAEEKFVSLFPGDEFTDKKGIHHEAGWSWDIFANEMSKQHPNLKGKGIEEQLVKLAGKTFNIYLYRNKKTGYVEPFMTLDSYNKRVDSLAKKAATEAGAEKAPWEE